MIDGSGTETDPDGVLTVYPRCMWPRPLSLDPRTGVVSAPAAATTPGGTLDLRTVPLTPTEARLALILFSSGRNVVDATDAALRVWGRGAWGDLGVVHTTVYRLKGKFARVGCRDLIKSRRGFGYQLDLVEHLDTRLVLIPHEEGGHGFAAGAGIVAAIRQPDGTPPGLLWVRWEENLHNCARLAGFVDRVHAASEALDGAGATASRGAVVPAEHFLILGYYSPAARRFDWQKPTWQILLEDWLGRSVSNHDLVSSHSSSHTSTSPPDL